MSDQTTTGPGTGADPGPAEDVERSVHHPGLPQFRDQRAVWAGIAVWAVLLVLALVFRQDLEDDGHGWWIWTAVTGIVLGLIARAYIRAWAVISDRRGDDPQDGPT